MTQKKEICYECGHSVAWGSGRFVDRIPSLDDYQTRVDMGVPFPGASTCARLAMKSDSRKLNIGEVYAIY